MKLFTVTTILICTLAYLKIGCADGVRHFRGGLDEVKTPFYAEFVLHAERHGKATFHSTHDVWYGNSTRYRFEITDWPDTGVRTYMVRRGNRMFSALVNSEKPNRAKWMVNPAFWMDDGMLSMIDRDHGMRDAVFLGSEEMHGVKVEHWRGRPAGANAASDTMLDVWSSTLERFPLVIKALSRREGSQTRWEISRLRLDESVPPYVFTPQIHPESGLIPLLKMQHKPLWFLFLRYVLILLAFAWLIIALMAKVKRARVLQVVYPGLLILGLYWIAPDTSQLHNHIDGLPLLFSMAASTVAMFMCVFQKVGAPGNFAFFRGTRWPVIVWATLAMTIGFLISASTRHHVAVESFGLSAWPPSFLPQTLATVVVFASTWAALEEIVFRGYLMGLLEKRFASAWRVNVIQSIVFTASHIPKIILSSSHQLPVGLVGILIFGLLFGGLRLRYRNLGAPWLVHTAFNTGYFYAQFSGLHAMLASIKQL